MYEGMTLREELAARLATATTPHDQLVLAVCMVATAPDDEAEAKALSVLYAMADAFGASQADIDRAEADGRAFMARHGLIEGERFDAIPDHWITDTPKAGQ